jgi:hypothetical protein
VIEAWSKRDGGDNWGRLLTTQNRTLETVTYRFTKHYFSGIQVWNLLLQADRDTRRDGPFNNNTTFNNAWYYAPISPKNPVIELPRQRVQFAQSLGTTKVQLGADSTEGADGAEHETCSFPKKIKILSKNGKNNVLLMSPLRHHITNLSFASKGLVEELGFRVSTKSQKLAFLG